MTSTQSSLQQPSTERSHAQQIEAVSWAVFFIWVGISMLFTVPWGWFLLGTGIIIVAAEFARSQLGLTIQGFWVACGLVFLAAGLWKILDLSWPLTSTGEVPWLPIALIVLGAGLLGKTVISGRYPQP